MKTCKLVAGEEGLDRIVTWPYYSELTEFGSWLTGGELIIFSGMGLAEPGKHLDDLINECVRVNASGLMLFVHESHINAIAPGVRDLCDQFSLPLFEVPWETKVIHLTRQISQLVMGRQFRAAASYSILKELLLNGSVQPEILREFKGENSGYLIAYMGIRNLEAYYKKNKIHQEADTASFELYMLRNAENWFELKQYQVKLSFVSNAIVLFVPLAEGEKPISFADFIAYMKKFNSFLSCFIGLSRPSRDLGRIRDKYLEAMRAAEFVREGELPVRSYMELGFSHLLYHINNKDVLEEYCNDIISPLITHDRETNGDLLDTLIRYLRSDCNINAVAKELSIHENSLRYRIKRIEEILGLNLKSYNAVTELNNAVKAGIFLGKIDR
jgi:hypothetical protein